MDISFCTDNSIYREFGMHYPNHLSALYNDPPGAGCILRVAHRSNQGHTNFHIFSKVRQGLSL
jgi:hypothetical protein